MTFERVEGTDFELPNASSCCSRWVSSGPQRPGLLEQLGVEINERGNVTRDEAFRTNLPNVFVCGDMGRGQSLIVWAIAEGRSCAAAVDEFLMGETLLPAPIAPDDCPDALKPRTGVSCRRYALTTHAGSLGRPLVHPSRAVHPGGSVADGPSSAGSFWCPTRVSAIGRCATGR